MSSSPDTTPAYFVRTGPSTFQSTVHAGGAWNPEVEIHFSPLGGLLVHAMDLHRAGRADRDGAKRDGATDDGKLLGRVSFDILGLLGTGECEIAVETTRPGRTIELVEATATIGGRAVVRARAWYLSASDTTAVAGGTPDPLPSPDGLEPWSMVDGWPGGYVASLEVRPISPPRPGRTTAWLSTDVQLVADEEVSAHAAFLALVDTANGIAVRQSPREWAFPNVDLTIHLHRQPRGRRVGLDTSVTFGPTGLGVTASVLHDLDGAVGMAHQLLTVRQLPA